MDTEEQRIILRIINKLDKRITDIAKDTCTYHIIGDWISNRQNTIETVRIQSTVGKIRKYILATNNNNKDTSLYEQTDKLYNRCDELLEVLDPQ